MIIKYRKNLLLYILLAAVLGGVTGAVIWALLRIMNLGIQLVWDIIPEAIGNEAVYTVGVCLLGGLLIGIWQKKFGIYPRSLEEVMHELRSTGTFPYNNILIVAVAALLPLIFGGCLGPEAGLTGIIAGMCCWVGDRLKYKGRQMREMAEAGMAASLGLVFNSPFIGIAFNYESEAPAEKEQSEEEKRFFKKVKLLVYIVAVAGGFGVMKLLGTFLGGGSGLPRFGRDVDITVDDWKWFIVVFAAGLVAGIFYMIVNRVTVLIGNRIINHRILSCMLAGLFLAFIGIMFPWTMFSGEHQIAEMMDVWQEQTAPYLMLTAFMKLLLVNICINLGWKGGSIFPTIFGGVSIGYAMAIVLGIEPLFAVAVATAALCGYVMRKPLMVIGVLLLCFPVTVIIPLSAAAYLGSILPAVPFGGKTKNKKVKEQ